MANVRINALTTTATSAASDDYFALDGTTNGTRKILGNRFALLSGATFTGGIVSTLGAISTSTPMLSGTQQWNSGTTAFTGLLLNVTNTASASGSSLMDLQVGGTSKFRIDGNGATTITATGQILFSVNVGSVKKFVCNNNGGFYIGNDANFRTIYPSGNGLNLIDDSNQYCLWAGNGNVQLRPEGYLGWSGSSNSPSSALDTAFYRNAAGVIEINNGTAGTFRDLKLRTITSSGGVIVYSNYTVSTLPTASSYTYGVVFVSDATQMAGTFIGTAPTGGGSVKRAVYSDGTNWLLL